MNLPMRGDYCNLAHTRDYPDLPLVSNLCYVSIHIIVFLLGQPNDQHLPANQPSQTSRTLRRGFGHRITSGLFNVIAMKQWGHKKSRKGWQKLQSKLNWVIQQVFIT